MTYYWESTVITIIAFGILFWLLNKYAFGPLFGIMEKRRQLVKEEIAAAEESRKAAEQYLAEQKQAVEEARRQAYEMIEQAKNSSSKQAEEIVQAARSEANRLKEEALRDIESEKNKAVAALRSQVSGMSVLIASKIIEKQIDEKSHQELIDRYLQEAGKES